ncbi:MAG TPA: DUF4232 domain-containing protein [Gaiellaceae bacterium]|nr:DUF4232 domain-containing protein [Gaiellaceae bacterium]
MRSPGHASFHDWLLARPHLSLAAAAVIGALLAVTVAASGRAATPVPSCATPRLVVWLDTTANGAAGSVYYHLKFTNLSGHACRMRGFPGVSAVTLVGNRIGKAASRSTSKVQTVRLAQGKTATALLRVVNTSNYPAPRCRPAIAAGLRVYPPGAGVSKVIPFTFRSCRRAVPVLSVGAVFAGAG